MAFRRIAITQNSVLQRILGKWAPSIMMLRKSLEASGFKLGIHGGTAIELEKILSSPPQPDTKLLSTDLDLIVLAYTHESPIQAVDCISAKLHQTPLGQTPWEIIDERNTPHAQYVQYKSSSSTTQWSLTIYLSPTPIS